MSRVTRILSFTARKAAIAGAILGLALTGISANAFAGERMQIKRHQVMKQHATRLPLASGRRTDLYGYAPRRIDRHANARSGVMLSSGRRTEGIYRWRNGWNKGWDNGHRYLNRRGDLLPGFDYEARRFVSDQRRFDPYIRDRGYDGYYNGFGYGRVWGYGTQPLIISVPGDGAAAPAADGAAVAGNCQADVYCVVRLGPYASSPKIITLNSGREQPQAPAGDPEVYDLDEQNGEITK
jgi:hypothetical protein